MIYINLLPVRQIKKKIQAQKRIMGMGFTLLCVLAVLGIVALVLIIQVNDLNADIKKLQVEKAKYQKTINQIAKLKKDQELLETKLNTISDLKKGSRLTVRVMDELASITPSNRVWLSRMAFSGRTLSISGTALDNATVADYMETIASSPYFTGARLSGTTSKGRFKTFSLKIPVINAEYAEKADKKNESAK